MKKPLLLLAIIMSFGQIIAQRESAWQKISTLEVSLLSRERENVNAEGELYFALDLNYFKQSLVNAKDKFSGEQGVVVEFPNTNGEIMTFNVWENSNMEAELQAKHPEIRSYVGQGISDKFSTINFSVSPLGVQTMVFKADNDMEFIERYDKQASAYVLFTSKNRNKGLYPFNCGTVDVENIYDANWSNNTDKASNAKYKTMRLALSCTSEYGDYFGGTKPLALAAMNATMTRVNGVMEKDLSLHLNIIANNDLVIYTGSTGDSYSPASTGAAGAWNDELMNNLHTVLGDSAFDIGHLFGASGGGGNAGCIGCVCNNSLATGGSANDSYKGSGYTSPSSNVPSGDTFDIDYVIHEMGHQLGANHTFTFGYEGSAAQTEPGSGSTIMGYAGITSYNVQAHSDALYCYKSIVQIQSNLNSSTKTCPVTTPLAGINATPVVTVDGSTFTIPISTPFKLNGSATDADGDALTYIWEQNDLGSATTIDASSRVLGTKTVGPNFRTFKPSANTFRYFPQMGKIMAGTLVVTASSNTNWESLSSVARTLHFSFTARDNHAGMGQTNSGATTVNVNATGGPFTVTSQATTGISYQGLSTQTVTWNVANTTAAPFNTANVDILLSTNASTALESNANLSVNPNPTTWTTVASGVPNNGSYVVTLPNVATSTATCRFMVKAAGNIYFAINSKNFTITPNLAIEQFGLDNFSLSPNPNNGSFDIKFDSASSNEIQVNVFDIRGREVYANSFKNTGLFNQNVNINNVQSGVYLVNVKDGDRKVVKKIVIE